ncbi:AT-rich interactive domain-containing protein 5B-like [Oncorhynchus masou masou]|uniref:AT-rich interactive domain-containing protein 5B-like n=1 Tax=Oncorhynchus masou masou TaxID=90313 RepID=UPI003184171D
MTSGLGSLEFGVEMLLHHDIWPQEFGVEMLLHHDIWPQEFGVEMLLHQDIWPQEFAPNLKGRPRKKKLSVSQRCDSQNTPAGKETCNTEGKAPDKVKPESKAVLSRWPKGISRGSSCCKRVSPKGRTGGGGEECPDEQAFLVALYKYMKERRTPIERIPYLGFKQINLWNMFQAAETLGGYELITSRRQWKHVYDELGGNPGSTSAATCTRRHYERLILPYERFTKGEEDKPLPLSKPRKDLTAQQEVPKTKVPTVTQCPKEEQHPENAQPPRTEQDHCAKGLELSPECEEKENSPEEEGVKVKQEVPLPAGEVSRSTSEEEEEPVAVCIKERVLHQGVSWENNEKPPSDTTTLHFFPVDTLTPINHSHPQDQWQKELPNYVNPCPQARLDQSGLTEEPQGPNPGMVGIVGVVLPIRQRSLQSPGLQRTPQTEHSSLDRTTPVTDTLLYSTQAEPILDLASTIQTPTIQAPTLASTIQAPTLAPTIQAPTLASTIQAPTLAPTIQASTIQASTIQAPTLAPTIQAPTLASTIQAPTLASTIQAPTLASTIQASTIQAPTLASTIQAPTLAATIQASTLAATIQASTIQAPTLASTIQAPTLASTIQAPTIQAPTLAPTIQAPTIQAPTIQAPTLAPTIQAPTIQAPTIQAPTLAPTIQAPTIQAPTIQAPTLAPTIQAPTLAPTIQAPTLAPTIQASTIQAPTLAPTIQAPTLASTIQAPTLAPTIQASVNGNAPGPSLPNHYAIGPPPPLINTSLAIGNAEESASQPIAGCQGSCSTDTAVVKRPSVIQHAQSFKPLFCETGDRREREGLNRNMYKPGEPYSPCDLTQHHPPILSTPQAIHHPQSHPPPQTRHHPQPHPNSHCDLTQPHPNSPYDLTQPHPNSPYDLTQPHPNSPYDLTQPHPNSPYDLTQPHRNSIYDLYLRSPETPQPGHITRFLPDFSPPLHPLHLHSLDNHTETHVSQFISSRERETALPRDCEAAPGPGGPRFPSSKHPDTMGLGGYCARINPLTPNLTPHTLRDRTSLVQTCSEDQPTDLSLPKSSPHKPTPSTATPSLHNNPHPLMPLQDTGRFCRVPPMTMSSSPRQPADPQPNPRGKTLNGQTGGWEDQGLGHKMEELNRPILGTKNTSRPQNNACTARPLKRSLEERENGPPERKIRAVTPMHSSSSSSSCTIRDRDREGHSEWKVRSPALEGVVPADPQPAPAHSLHLHINSFVEGHKFHSSPLFPRGLYPEAFISQIQDMCEGLGSHRPLGYHPLQYLKNQAGLSPLVPPFAFHSFMMQRQAHSPAHMYRHPMRASYGELLHHGLHPMSSMSALSTQLHPDISPSQLSSVHPNTKLS